MKICIGIPTRGRIHALQANALIGIWEDRRYVKELFFSINSRSVEESRNFVASQFLKSDCDYLLSMDDDVVPLKNPLDLVKLDLDIIGLPVPVVRGKGISYGAYQEKEGKYPDYPKKEGLQEVDAISGGCMLIARRVLENLDKPFSALYNEQGLWALSEDLNFCKRAKEKGFKIFAHFNYPCQHYSDVELSSLI